MLKGYNQPGFDEQFGNVIFSSYLMVGIIFLIYYAIAFVMALWVHKNAKIRKMKYKIWFLGVFLTGFIGLLVYLVIRDPLPPEKTL